MKKSKSSIKSKFAKEEQEIDKSLLSLTTIDLNVFTVKITKLSFSYSRSKKAANILEGINMSFPKSSIYGLLGPSGSGKTTLLKLILGIKKPKSGKIQVNGRAPSDPINKIPGTGVGFQPQEMALYQEFTIRETLNYFAEIYGMRKEDKLKRIEFLIKFLELPDPDRSVKNLSGGQQRRVSLAIAVVHNPPFLILDEPTVGVDPLLRERIWDHLVYLSNTEKTSILVTTHYIEEARRAHVIALLRSGKLLVEQTPKYLLNHFEADNLEEVFVRVCKVQEEKDKQYLLPKSFIQTNDQKMNAINTQITEVHNNISVTPSHWKRFECLINKNVIRITRNLIMLAFQILTPTLTMILFCLCIGKSPNDLEVAIFNEEDIWINETEKPQHKCKYNNFSHYFIESIDRKNLKLIKYNSNESAIRSVKDSETYGALIIDKYFSSALCYRLSNESSRAQSQIQYFGDQTDVTIFQTIARDLIEAEIKFPVKMSPVLNEILKDYENATNGPFPIKPEAMIPILNIVKPPIYGSEKPSFRDFMTPGMMISVIFILAVGLTSLSFVVEKKEGLLERTLLAGVKIYEILLAQIFVQIFVLFLQITVLMVIVFPIFEIENKGSYYLIVLINLLQGVAGMSYGLVISTITPDEHSALLIGFGSFFPVLLMSGVFWPLEGMSDYMQLISKLLPQTLSVFSLRNIMLKGLNITNAYVFFGYISSVAWIIIFLTTAIILASI